MNATEKKKLAKEAKMQMEALKRINKWKNIALAISTLGVAIIYAGVAGIGDHLFLNFLGAAVLIIGIVAALVLNLGLKNGRRNVEKMLHALN